MYFLTAASVVAPMLPAYSVTTPEVFLHRFRILFTKPLGRNGFELLDDICHALFGFGRQQNMHVSWHYFQSLDRILILTANLKDLVLE